MTAQGSSWDVSGLLGMARLFFCLPGANDVVHVALQTLMCHGHSKLQYTGSKINHQAYRHCMTLEFSPLGASSFNSKFPEFLLLDLTDFRFTPLIL